MNTDKQRRKRSIYRGEGNRSPGGRGVQKDETSLMKSLQFKTPRMMFILIRVYLMHCSGPRPPVDPVRESRVIG